MTGRRKNSRKGAARKESPEKSSRRSSRRRPKSESESESDASKGEQESKRSDTKSKNDGTTSIDGSKEDESGGSDGAWHVRSENGNKGGIPKLKLCLSRPSEVPSPTSESLPSPKPKRSKRGTTDSPSKQDDSDHAIVVENVIAAEEIEMSSVLQEEDVENAEEQERQANDDMSVKDEEMKEEQQEVTEHEVEESMKKGEKDDEQLERYTEEVVVNDAVNNTEEEVRRSPSRDSSEERAKEAALNSRKRKGLKKEGSEDGEVVESPEREIAFPSRVGPRIRTTGSSVSSEQSKENLNAELDVAPIVRKRRWGSSGNRTASKVPVLISTDVLKEIIPEAKPVPANEVQLSPNREDDVGNDNAESRDRRNSRASSGGGEDITSGKEEMPRTSLASLSRKRRDIPSDESEKDYEDGGLESGGEDGGHSMTKMSESVKETDTNHQEKNYDGIAVTRKVSVLPPENSIYKKLKSPSPARHSVSNVLYVTNLVRPFTVPQLKDLLARTGSIADDGFWIDKIKSQCYVKYLTEEEAVTTRNALHRVRWPASNPKELVVDYATEEALQRALVDGKLPQLTLRGVTKPSMRLPEEKNDKIIERERDRERSIKSSHDHRLEDRERKTRLMDGKDHSERTVRRVTIPVREWDMGKTERGFSPPPFEGLRRYEGRERDLDDEHRKRVRGKDRRSSSEEPVRKVVRKDEPAPAKLLLEDIFRKTKTLPSIYWLPLTAEQIAVKEEMRRKHMAEHEKKIADSRKRREAKRRRGSHSRSRSPK